jgi:thiamine-phosphate pyrophosphorylase
MSAAQSPAVRSLHRTARTLRPRTRPAKSLPRLFFFTDPVRTPDPHAIVRRLPCGAGVVYRAFGRPDAEQVGRRLIGEARRRGLSFLVGADARLAAALRADGVHLPESMVVRAGALRRSRRTWIVTCAAHSQAAIIRARRARVHAVFVSPVFASTSPSAGAALGPLRFAVLVRSARLPVLALGGVNAATARRLAGSGAYGVAAVEAFAADSLGESG